MVITKFNTAEYLTLKVSFILFAIKFLKNYDNKVFTKETKVNYSRSDQEIISINGPLKFSLQLMVFNFKL